jgi:2-keto-4-pentenoate hydratase/2-oxohepta-3-ene-1,7-dioic acid hydratase in catechol pathway
LKAKGLPWEKAKAFDNSAVVGKWVDLKPEMLKAGFGFSLKKNNELVQNGHSKEMLFSFDAIVANISNYQWVWAKW